MAEHNRPRFPVGRRTVLGYGAALGGAAAMSSLIGVESLAADKARVNMQLGWLASNGILGEVVAKRMGYYKELGIELNVTPGGPGVDGVASVAAGRAQVGHLSSSPSLMLARSAGIPVKAFAAGYQKHPFTYFSMNKNPIRTPKDMIGKTIATQPTAVILLRALLAKNGIAEDQVEVVKMGSDMSQLMTGRVAAVTGWMTNTNALKILGKERVDMMLWDAGIQLYANVYYATDDMLSKHADVLTRFLTGSARGWGFARKNPEAADRSPGGGVQEPEQGERARGGRRCSGLLLRQGDGEGRLGGHEQGELAGPDRRLRAAQAVQGNHPDRR